MTAVDPEMQEVVDAISSAIVPRSHRRAAVRTNYHTPYYSKSRYRYY